MEELFEPYNAHCTSYGRLVGSGAATFALSSSVVFENFHEKMARLFLFLNVTNVDDYSIAVAFFDPALVPLFPPSRCFVSSAYSLRPTQSRSTKEKDIWSVEVEEGEGKAVGFCIAIVDTFMLMGDILSSSPPNVYGHPKFHSYSFSMTCLTILLFGQKIPGKSGEDVREILKRVYGEEVVRECESENGKMIHNILTLHNEKR